ncbi:LysR family transcriptional regulator [Actinoplanes lobatus]|uniref:DNA-binding transcriptional LysR family regulator n=1 Tax=Actinoplanes lobatus TaxID=113568 RepID=A0A7W7MH35_9ACTN|nr:LysR substrate-binding domain-containing protein [Actinoplanes lobatus]MBB4749911.1 DNA-binding transcriptional LysR family regulator [Actinoplanes lobatus]GGN95156.1 LysR family transcriptional regulator [Actinoplanes lobatus]GIE45002.1 LysR family transcriptional regulator [Actinoplanes lobatus]
MSRILDIAPLRSLVAVADCGGFQRAATSLHLSQGAVSQHVRRLETTLGRALVERDGRGSRFTTDGEALLTHARRILALHDEALHTFGVEGERSLVIGSTEHAAAQLLPDLTSALAATFPDRRIRFRIDRGAQLRSALQDGRIDLALLLGPADESDARTVGELRLTWYSSPEWTSPPPGEPIPLVVFDAPCALRSRALETLAAGALPTEVGCEAAHLAGVQAAVRAGLGVGLMATLGQQPEGLAARDDLPPPEPLELSVWPRRGLPPELVEGAATALTKILTVAG